MKDGLIINLLSVLPRNLVSRTMGMGTRLALPESMHRGILRWYVDHYGVNLDECAGGIDDYPTIAEFFTRPLLPGVRPVDEAPEALGTALKLPRQHERLRDRLERILEPIDA